MAVLEIKNIAKSYGKIKALDGVSFDVPPGSVFGILGPNGSGKTTLLSIILDILQSDQGSYTWFGQEPSHLHRKKIGSLLETPNVYHYLTAVQNLRITQSVSGRGAEEEIDEVLTKVNLYDRRNSRFTTYSLGMKQRLAIAGALLGRPSVLVLDEPTNGLDPVGIAEIRELIKELATQGHTVIMASHLLDEVEKVCNHVAILKKGKLLTHGPVDDILSDEECFLVCSEHIPALRNAMNQFPDVLRIVDTPDGIECYFHKSTTTSLRINEFCFKKGIVLSQLYNKKKRLEEKFFELTND
ncbi:MAG: ABC transporter ATP-binding protein [Chitinophagaceae bacterium]|nr:MAG: ABC transporter ATP-binding protein [Chitinophagaceae bacterium]